MHEVASLDDSEIYLFFLLVSLTLVSRLKTPVAHTASWAQVVYVCVVYLDFSFFPILL